MGKTVNAPGHFHSVFTVESLSEKLERAGFVNCHGERCTAVPVFPGEPPVPLIYVYAYKSKYTGGASLQREASHRENLDR